jgi:hypothetical protein
MTVRPFAELLEDGRLAIRAPKCVLVLSAEEIARLVVLDVSMWARALRRGKAFLRAEAAKRRTRPRDA